MKFFRNLSFTISFKLSEHLPDTHECRSLPTWIVLFAQQNFLPFCNEFPDNFHFSTHYVERLNMLKACSNFPKFQFRNKIGQQHFTNTASDTKGSPLKPVKKAREYSPFAGEKISLHYPI